MQLELRYLYHSGFTVSADGFLLVFDYWEGEDHELPLSERLDAEKLKAYEQVFVFISHGHPDHFDEQVYGWGEEVPVTYIIGYDLPGAVRGTRLWPGDVVNLNSRLTVRAFGSTDLGVSFYVTLDELNIFHAGDLNFWHWREESTVQEIEEAETEFHAACKPIIGLPIDICMFPVDPRQGRLYDAGANYFIMTARPRVLLPMHFWSKSDVIQEFARRARSNQTEVIALTESGERMQVETDEDGFMTLNLLPPDVPLAAEYIPQGQAVDMTGYEGDDPFWNTDEPVPMD